MKKALEMRKRFVEYFSETRKRTHDDSDAQISPKSTKIVDVIFEYLSEKKREKRNYEKLLM